MTNTSTLQAGSSVESQCKKCKTVTDHHVVAMNGEKIVKVQCKVCSARHAYLSPATEKAPKEPKVPKEPKALKEPKAPRAKKSVVAPHKAASTEQWEKLVNDGLSRVSYAMTASFQVGDIMEHPTFGRGYVQKCYKPCTVEVLFEDGLRNMRCAPFK